MSGIYRAHPMYQMHGALLTGWMHGADDDQKLDICKAVASLAPHSLDRQALITNHALQIIADIHNPTSVPLRIEVLRAAGGRQGDLVDRVDRIGDAFVLAKDVSSDLGRAGLLRTAMHLEQPGEVMGLAHPLMEGIRTGDGRNFILLGVEELLGDRVTSRTIRVAARSALALAGGVPPYDCSFTRFRLMSGIADAKGSRANKKRWTVEVAPMLPGVRDARGSLALFEQVAKLEGSPEQRRAWFDETAALTIGATDDGGLRATVLRHVAAGAGSPEERRTHLEFAMPLLRGAIPIEEGLDGLFLAVTAMQGTDEEKRALIDLSLPLVCRYVDPRDRSTVFRTIMATPGSAEQKRTWVGDTTSLIHHGINAAGCVEVFTAVAALQDSPEQATRWIERTRPLVRGVDSGDGVVDVLRAVVVLTGSEEEIDQTIARASLLMVGSEFDFNRSRMRLRFVRIPGIEAVVGTAEHPVSREHLGEAKVQEIQEETTRRVKSAEDQVAVMASGRGRSTILREVDALRGDPTPAIILPLMRDLASTSRCSMFRAIAAIPGTEEEKRAWVEATASLIDYDSVDGEERVVVFTIVATLPGTHAQTREWTQQAKSLVQGLESGQGIGAVLRAVAELTGSEETIQQTIADARSLMVGSTVNFNRHRVAELSGSEEGAAQVPWAAGISDGPGRAAVLWAVAALPDGPTRKSKLAAAQAFVPREPSNQVRANVIDTIRYSSH